MAIIHQHWSILALTAVVLAANCLLNDGGLLAPVSKAAAQVSSGTREAEGTVPCESFRKNRDGSWTATHAVTVRVGSWSVTAGANTLYAPNAININGVDFAKFLDTRCRR
jgi:hypothetical protein